MSRENRYMYGIIEEPQFKEFDFTGVEEARVYTINYQNIAAIVSDTSLKEIDPTRRNVLAHTMVQDRVIKNYTVLPMGFGMVAGSANIVNDLLRINYDKILGELERLSGKIEVAVKVYWDKDAMLSQLGAENKTIAQAKARLKTATPAQAQAILVEIGQTVERTTKEWKTRYATEAYSHLNKLAVEARANPEMDVKNILNASFLIPKTQESRFQNEVYQLDAKYRGKLNFKYIGPLPPYNFVQMRMEAPNAA